MAEMRVQCPNCQAKMKLTAAIEKVRCPKCDEIFLAAKNQVRPASKKTASSGARRKQQSSADVFGFDDDESDDDLFSSSPPRKKRAKPASKSSRKKSSFRKRQANAIPVEQLRKFGGTMIFLGIGAFVLPFVGLQIKGLNAMPPEMQSLGGICFLILGAVIIGVSFLEDLNLGGAVENGFQYLKWGVIGVFALLIGVPLLLVGGRAAWNALPGGKNDQHDQIAEQMHQDAMQRHQEHIDRMNQSHRPAMNNTNNSSGAFFNESDTSSSQTSTTQSSDPTSPFQDVTSFSSNSTQMNSSSTSASPRSYAAQEETSSSNGSNPFVSAAPEEVTVIVNLKGFSRRDAGQKMFELRKAAQTFRMRPLDLNDGSSRIEFRNVKGLQAFADRIPFGRVTNVDTENNEITVEQ